MTRQAWLSALLCLLCAFPARAQLTDQQRLARALDYFQGNKFHEALLLFEPLDRKYALNARYRAYMGVCYYHDWEYEKATQYLDSVMADIVVYAPLERSVYYYANAESHFQLGLYAQAIPLYRMNLLVCHDYEQGEQHFKLALCHLQLRQDREALSELEEAEQCYNKYDLPEKKARLAQINNMIAGLRAELEKP